MANNLETGKKVVAVSMLCEGNSIRSIERITGVHRDTIMRLGLRMGENCQQIMASKMRGLTCKQVECDEIWGFIGAKRKNANRVGAYGDLERHRGSVHARQSSESQALLRLVTQSRRR
jgi:hypothetical protein